MIVFTTLAENDYFLGVAALINSMVKHGTYGDKMIVGYRGDLPKWLPSLSPSRNGQSFMLSNNFEVEFVPVIGSLHMVHEKPKWFRYLTEVLEPGSDEYFFFDSDILIINRMSFFGEWVKQGVALCEDVNYDMGLTHPIRKQWVELCQQNEKNVTNQLSRYINSGFLGWTKETSDFVVDWDECSMIMAKISGDMKKFRVNDRTKVVLSTNQDSLNMAAMVTKCPLSVIGPAAMGFHFGLKLMLHPLGPKPWTRKFFKEFLMGIPVRSADVMFWEVLGTGELRPYSKGFIQRKKLVIKLVRFLTRFYGRK
ncbi:hypothetical protein [Pedobacter metabolipauper]|uniref:Uncharacterized protein n=1 Tax=Pedobacter metabolipauper TaxID=425513 RepID=A0A4R6SX34_9SPHI|nr:hypothetical protein [Pedobacter metabolipauper]TDQ09986.1 hypothetical protein ATK78_2145 [Pedobacter metabolipauper]